jgi:hypothetical protein
MAQRRRLGLAEWCRHGPFVNSWGLSPRLSRIMYFQSRGHMDYLSSCGMSQARLRTCTADLPATAPPRRNGDSNATA